MIYDFAIGTIKTKSFSGGVSAVQHRFATSPKLAMTYAGLDAVTILGPGAAFRAGAFVVQGASLLAVGLLKKPSLSEAEDYHVDDIAAMLSEALKKKGITSIKSTTLLSMAGLYFSNPSAYKDPLNKILSGSLSQDEILDLIDSL